MKTTALRAVPPAVKIEHKAICSVDGEPWPCRHEQAENNFRVAQHFSVFCMACGKQRNAWASLMVESDMKGRAVYFHARKRCVEAAKKWWDENVKPHTGEELLISTWSGATIGGRWIDDIGRYIGLRAKPTAAIN